MKIGNFDKNSCAISINSPNESVLITGMSGTGKTCRLYQIELDSVIEGDTVIVVDISHTHDIIYEPIRNEFEKYVNRIELSTDGFCFDILSKEVGRNNITSIDAIVQAFGISQNMGTSQISTIREWFEEGFNIAREQCTLSEALARVYMKHKGDVVWESVYQRIGLLIKNKVLDYKGCNICAGKINVISFSGLELCSSDMLIELFLSFEWRYASLGLWSKGYGKVRVVIDEFQHCSLGKNSMLRVLLREGRKFGLSLLLATQSLKIFSEPEKAMLNQVSTRMCFRPGDMELMRDAKLIDATKYDIWQQILAELERGECVAIGCFEVKGVTITRPIVLH